MTNIDRMITTLKCRLHRNESGAVMLLLLAAFLILFMVALTVYDAGVAAQDKTSVQIAADTSAYSHSVVKSRSMNMIVYANIIKRMYFSYAVSYVNGLAALIIVAAAHVALCFKWLPRPKSCAQLISHGLMILMEVAESLWHLETVGVSPLGFSEDQATPDLRALERYQKYMFSITPWWSWAENVIRGFNNGATTTASWPPPAGNILDKVKSFATGALGTIDWGFGTDFLGLLPSVTNAVDTLPVTRRDRQKTWSTEYGPFVFTSTFGAKLLASVEYCTAWTFSLEWFVNTTQTILKSDDLEWFRLLFAFFQAAGGSIGCAIVNGVWGELTDSDHLDWKINTPLPTAGGGPSPNKWLQMTSNLTYAYRARAGRNSDEGDRQKFGYVSQDHGRNFLHRNEGYFGMARSELVYKPAIGTANNFLSAAGNLPIIGSQVLGLQPGPDMWSPRWTARLRPTMLPGEELTSSTHDAGAGFDTIVADTVPYLLMATVITGILDEKFSIQSGFQDLAYLWRASRTFTTDPTKGLSK